jgi:hypothetical protein
MSQTQTPVETGQRDATVDQGGHVEPAAGRGHAPRRSQRVVSLVAGCIACAFAVVFLAGGGWALWKDRVDRDAAGFVPIRSTTLRTSTYAIAGDLHGDGPAWLWESAVLGDTRVRATSLPDRPLFIGIARTDDVNRYLRGVGYATIEGFAVDPDTTHAGGAPSGPPSRTSIWAASTQGTGRQTLRWDSRSGDWSIVFMNAQAGAGVAVHGDAAARFPILPWLAGGLLIVGVALGVVGTWVLVRAFRHERG